MRSEAQILLFSDIPDECEVIEQTIREVSGTEKVRVASDEKAALELLSNEKFELVFARSKRGALACTDFLNEVWKINPKSTRFVLANTEPESEALVRCALGAHQFIPTPVDPVRLAGALERAESIKRFVRTEKIHTLVSRMRTLPSRPSLYVELMRELRSVSASAGTVGELVSKDLAISTKLIQVANSAFFGLDQQVSEPAAAVLQLGLETTASLVLSIEAFARFDKVKPLYFSIDRVWKHSQSVADLARKICHVVGCDSETSGQAYTAGLLHDIGKLAFAQNFEEDYQRTLKEAETKSLPVYEVEQLVFGGTHAETGAYLLAVWGLPLPIVEAVADHHLPAAQLSAPFSATTALHLAEQLAGAPERIEEILEGYPVELGLSPFLEALRSLVDSDNHQVPKRIKQEDQTAKTGGITSVSARVKASRSRPAETQNRIEKRHVLYIVSATALVVASALSFFLFRTPTQRSHAAERPESSSSTQRESALAKSAPKPVIEPSKTAETASRPPDPNLKLQAIMYNGEKSGLIINGTMLHSGESIDGWRVLSVRQRDVLVEKGGEQRTLNLQ